MKFEYKESILNDGKMPDLVIPVQEIVEAKDFDKSEKANNKFRMLQTCMRIFTAYCGDTLVFDRKFFSDFCDSLGKKGSLIISVIPTDEGWTLLMRVIANDEEKTIDYHLRRVVARGSINE